MAKTNVKGTSGQIVIHSSDGKDAALAPSSGQPMATTLIGGKTTNAHGQVKSTTVVFDNPGQ